MRRLRWRRRGSGRAAAPARTRSGKSLPAALDRRPPSTHFADRHHAVPIPVVIVEAASVATPLLTCDHAVAVAIPGAEWTVALPAVVPRAAPVEDPATTALIAIIIIIIVVIVAGRPAAVLACLVAFQLRLLALLLDLVPDLQPLVLRLLALLLELLSMLQPLELGLVPLFLPLEPRLVALALRRRDRRRCTPQQYGQATDQGRRIQTLQHHTLP